MMGVGWSVSDIGSGEFLGEMSLDAQWCRTVFSFKNLGPREWQRRPNKLGAAIRR